MISIIISTWLPVLSLIFGGCCYNVITFEKLIQEFPQTTNFITFCQFFLISLIGWYYNDFKFTHRIPIKRWLIHVVIFFITSLLNNYVLNLKISMPIYVIFRSSGTIFTILIGKFFFKRNYNSYQLFSGVLLTIGLILTTIGNSKINANLELKIDFKSMIYLINPGIFLLILSSILISINGFLLELTFSSIKDKKNLWKESLFFQHFLSLPFFLIFGSSIINESKDYVFYLSNYEFKPLSVLALNLLTQFVCVRGINKLNNLTNSLTVSVILLLRKFISLILSIIIFKNTLNQFCWLGIGFIFSGTFIYSYGSSLKKIKTY